MSIDWLSSLYRERSSIRAFTGAAIARDQLEALFENAQRAPSWCNIQPWRVYVTSEDKTREISAALIEAASSGVPTPELTWPPEYPQPYLARRRACGHALYGAMGIERGDKAGRWAAWLRNYEIFDAPHLAVVCRERRLGEYATLDVGVWLGFLFTTAAAMGIDMCAMASLAAYPAPLRAHIEIPESELILFGIALGLRDAEAAANKCRTERDDAASSVTFVGFDA